jgi:hypothetical protein
MWEALRPVHSAAGCRRASLEARLLARAEVSQEAWVGSLAPDWDPLVSAPGKAGSAEEWAFRRRSAVEVCIGVRKGQSPAEH